MTSKNIKGEVMSASNGGRGRMRISLLAGSSLAAAGLAFGGLALAPTSAAAQATCAPPPASGNMTDAVVYNAGTYNPGITCVYTGGDATVSTAGAITVSTLAGGNGVNLSAVGADAITWNSTAGSVTGGAQTNGPVIDATSVSGSIDITTAAITGTQISVTHGVQAVSTGGGAVSVTNVSGNVNINSNTAGAQQQSGIRAVSTGGNGAVSVTTAGTVTGRLRGIEAQSSGTGALTITSTGAVNVNNVAGVAAIDARTGAGLLTVNIDIGSGIVNGQSGVGILTNAGGNAAINIAAGRTVQVATASTSGAINATAVGATMVNNAGTLTAGTTSALAIRAAGGGFALSNSGALTGRLDLGSVTGATSVTNSGTWSTSGTSDFGPGASTLTNSGTLTGSALSTASTFTGLETFNNSGTVVLATRTLTAAGADFTGSGDSRLNITTTLDPAGTSACGSTISGCLDLTGGTTAGVTSVAVTVSGDQDITLFSPTSIVLVDVSEGTSAAGHFVLDEASTGFAEDRLLGSTLGAGLFGFTLRYNADTQQHVLISAPRADAFEYAPVIHQALSTWHTTTDLVTARQADLAAGAGGGLWVRAAVENSDRELVQSFTSGGNTFSADNGYALETSTVIAGFDLLKGEDVTIGVHGGLVQTELSFDGSATSDELTGPTAGVYGSWRAGPFSLDGTLNANLLELERTSPTFEDSVTNVMSWGGRAEAAYRIGGQFYIQPLITAAYVKSTIDDVLPTGYDIAFEDAVSSRAAIGVRVGGVAGALRAWAVARAWNEFAGDGRVSINNTGTTTGVTFADDLSGNFQEFGAGLSIANEGDTLRGYVSAGAKIADDIDNYTFSIGAQLRW